MLKVATKLGFVKEEIGIVKEIGMPNINFRLNRSLKIFINIMRRS